MPKLMSALVAEMVGAFALCFVGVLAIYQFNGVPGGLIGVALAHGLILSIMITVFAATSGGHLNPAVTVGLLVGGKIKAGPAAGYIAAQVLGGVLAGLAVLGILPHDAAALAVLKGTPTLGSADISVYGGCLAELIATFFLVLAVWGTAVDPRAPKIGGFGIGLTVTAGILAIGPLTGGALNPARALGPALAAALAGEKYDWAHHWIYWVGPVAGGILASVLYTRVMGAKETPGA